MCRSLQLAKQFAEECHGGKVWQYRAHCHDLLRKDYSRVHFVIAGPQLNWLPLDQVETEEGRPLTRFGLL